MPRLLLLLYLGLFAAGCSSRPHHRPHTYPPETLSRGPVSQPVGLRLVVLNFDTMEVAEASAFFVSADGLLVTCAHVVAGATPLGVYLPDGQRVTVTEVASDPEADLAILRADRHGPFPALPLAPNLAALGQSLRAVTKDGTAWVLNAGPAADAQVGDVIAFDASELGPGASGGALLGAGGVVGIIQGGFEGSDRTGAAVPVTRLRALLEQAAATENDS